jgi:hypothetical protein
MGNLVLLSFQNVQQCSILQYCTHYTQDHNIMKDIRKPQSQYPIPGGTQIKTYRMHNSSNISIFDSLEKYPANFHYSVDVIHILCEFCKTSQIANLLCHSRERRHPGNSFKSEETVSSSLWSLTLRTFRYFIPNFSYSFLNKYTGQRDFLNIVIFTEKSWEKKQRNRKFSKK